jgi:hypothetical protein
MRQLCFRMLGSWPILVSAYFWTYHRVDRGVLPVPYAKPSTESTFYAAIVFFAHDGPRYTAIVKSTGLFSTMAKAQPSNVNEEFEKILEAGRKKNWAALKKQLEQYPALLNYKSKLNEQTLLYIAAKGWFSQ